MPPLVSVIMPVFNGEKYLREALDSILHQSLSDFEFIIVDDASTDGSAAILDEFGRGSGSIRMDRNAENLGLPGTLNRLLELAAGEFIARMDQDDVSRPGRLERQVQFMQSHPEVGVCGCWAEIIGARAGNVWKFPCRHDEIYARMLFQNALVHSSVMLRASSLRRHSLSYDAGKVSIEDYDLWSRALPWMRFANLPEPLLLYRLHGANTGNVNPGRRLERRSEIYQRFLSRLGMEFTRDDLALHEQIGSDRFAPDLAFLQRARRWLEKMDEANEKTRLIAPDALRAELGARWTQVCQSSRVSPFSWCFEVFASPLPFRGRRGFLKILAVIKFFLGRIVPRQAR